MAREKDRLIARIAEKPDLTLRALLAELAERDLVVSYCALWHFVVARSMLEALGCLAAFFVAYLTPTVLGIMEPMRDPRSPWGPSPSAPGFVSGSASSWRPCPR